MFIISERLNNPSTVISSSKQSLAIKNIDHTCWLDNEQIPNLLLWQDEEDSYKKETFHDVT